MFTCVQASVVLLNHGIRTIWNLIPPTKSPFRTRVLLMNQVLWKIISSYTIASIFAHAITWQLWWHVQAFVVIITLGFRWEENENFIEKWYETWVNKKAVNIFINIITKLHRMATLFSKHNIQFTSFFLLNRQVYQPESTPFGTICNSVDATKT